jgi:VIT1/CCC1 family predicted Fe2+/Mn2+ transporter
MALTFTTTFGVATAEREDVRTMLVGAIGCNIAWGLVDAVMFLMSSLTEQGHALLAMRAVRSAGRPEEAHRVIRAGLPPLVASILTRDDVERMRQGLLGIEGLPPAPSLTRDDWLKALGVFLLVFLSTFPLVIPFLVFRNLHFALRVSNAIALVMLFLTGYSLARHGGHHPWRTGLSVMLIGVVLVAIAIALGG